MERSTSHIDRSTSWWITSLAISVTCCAIMFVIFAGYVADLRKDIAAQDSKIEELSQQQTMLLSEIDTLHHPVTDSIPQTPVDSIIPKTDAPDAMPGTLLSQPTEGASQQAPLANPNTPIKP